MRAALRSIATAIDRPRFSMIDLAFAVAAGIGFGSPTSIWAWFLFLVACVAWFVTSLVTRLLAEPRQ